MRVTVVEEFLVTHPALRRLWRFAVTSGVATVVSEATLVALYATGTLGAAGSAIVATAVGTGPAYLLSRYWIWPDANRSRPGRQAAAYWLVSLIGLVLSSAASELAAANAPAGHAAHVAVVATVYIGTYVALWLGKFAVCQGLLFKSG